MLSGSVFDAIVVGGGISGLSAAYALHKAAQSGQNSPGYSPQGYKLCVLEAGEQTGGLIQTSHEDGFIVEQGPQTIPGRATELLALCRELNVDLIESNSLATRRYIYLKNELEPLPAGRPDEALLTPILSWQGKWRALQELRTPTRPTSGPPHHDDISLTDFFTKHFGPEVVENLLDPFISGIYAGDINRLSLPAVFPMLHDWEAEHGSLIKAAFLKYREARNSGKPAEPEKKKLFSIPGGLRRLILALTLSLPPDTIRRNTPVQSLQRHKGNYLLETADGEILQTRRLILATPAWMSAQLLQPLSPLLSDALAAIPYASMSVVHTGFSRSAIEHPLDGFGFLVPRREKLALLGSVWISSLFPERALEHFVLFTNYLGGMHRPDLIAWDDQRLLDTTLNELSGIFKTREPLSPLFHRIVRHERAIPQYILGHRERLQTIDWALGQHAGLALCGNYLNGVALNDCVKSATQAVERSA